jgi:transcriptional regulator with XRE-family HTH domain
MSLKTLGARLKQAREDAGLNQTELSTRSGVPQPTISQVEGGKQSLDGENLVKLSLALRVRPEWLMANTGPRQDPMPKTGRESFQKLTFAWDSLVNDLQDKLAKDAEEAARKTLDAGIAELMKRRNALTTKE